MKKQNFFFILSVLTILFGATFESSARILRVNNQGYSADYTDLEVAINAANPGDTIHVEPSGISYSGTNGIGGIDLAKPLVILGPGYFLATNPGLQYNTASAIVTNITFLSGSSGAVVSGIQLGNNNLPVFYIHESNITIERCLANGVSFNNSLTDQLNNLVIRQSYFAFGTYIQNIPGPLNNLQISNCYFGNTVYFASSGSPNTAQGNISNCVFNNGVISYSSPLNFTDNIFKGGNLLPNNVCNSISNINYNLFNSASVPSWLNGGTNLNQANNIFLPAGNSPDSSLIQNTQPNCPNCYLGSPIGGGHQIIGMFGGATPYEISGISAIPTIYQLTVTPSSLQGTPIDIHISTRSNN